MKITGHHLTPDNDLQRSDCLTDDGQKCRRITRPYSVDEATGLVTLLNPYVSPRWEVFSPRDGSWSDAYPDVFAKELERQFVDELIRVNLNQKAVLGIV